MTADVLPLVVELRVLAVTVLLLAVPGCTVVTGVLVAVYQTLSFQGGAQILLLIFAAVTLGGLGSAYGALVGALILSLFVELSTFIIPTSMKNVAAMIVMIAILLIRPSGILGKAQRVG